MPTPALLLCKEKGHLNRSVQNLSGESTATRYFVVQYDTQVSTVYAESTVGLPVAFEIHPDDTTAYKPRVVKTIEARGDDESKTIYMVQVDYSNQLDVDPLTAPPQISWDFNDDKEAYFLDNSTPPKPVRNSAGEMFENLLERETGSIRAVYKVNLSSYSPATAVTYKDAVNSDSFTIDGVSIDANQAKMKAITGGGVQQAIVDGTPINYRVVTYTIDFRPSWDDVIDDRGLNETATASGGGTSLKAICGVDPPTQVNKPWPLNGSGAAKPNATDTPSSLTFKPYNKMAFSGFDFV